MLGICPVVLTHLLAAAVVAPSQLSAMQLTGDLSPSQVSPRLAACSSRWTPTKTRGKAHSMSQVPSQPSDSDDKESCRVWRLCWWNYSAS